ncbi:pyridoxal-phosphate dependent enzyme [Escherichia coli]
MKGTKGKTDLISAAVELTDFPVIAQALAGEEIKPGPQKFRVLALVLSQLTSISQAGHKVIGITNEEAISTARRLMEEEGILAASSGAAVAAALKLQEDESFTNKNIVVILTVIG